MNLLSWIENGRSWISEPLGWFRIAVDTNWPSGTHA
ncbi:hypothetical protein BamIOP4010DRAFT_3785 [Burkholderia ambifaria IOP40-10]|uniref:Uncharacterized protein n=1 Tax=Burkholderia ambifaria IOP40-10 TaxID=396596 RepID=B1FIC5_9BURK|nr:hypothetical protein BamIOP4010DRAFT_3785 [Burkholderia ambifaria IOP40-10]